MEINVDQVKALAEKYFDEVLGHRHYLHAHPELSFEEEATARYISDFLTKNGIEHTTGLGGGTGIVAELGAGGPIIALRADMDALPIRETNEVNYKSLHNGVMHACGHDVHTASLMGACLILNELKYKLNHRVRCIFQPGEEKLPGGATLMIADGAIDGINHILGQHVHPSLPSGKLGLCKGYFMASADEIFITVIGKGGHAARPQEVVDTVLVSAELIQSLQSVVSRNSDPMTASVLSIGKVQTDGGATNIIPDRVFLEGTFRTFDETWRYKAHDLILRKIKNVTQSHGATAEVDIKVGYPALLNDEKLTDRIEHLIGQYIGQENLVHLPPRMTAEDFAFYSHIVPACFYRLGTGVPGDLSPPTVHSSTFDIDESALKVSIGVMAWLALAG